MKVVYKSVVDEINDLVDIAKKSDKKIDHIILNEQEAWDFFVRFESVLRMGEFKGFLDFKKQLKLDGFWYERVKLKMEKENVGN